MTKKKYPTYSREEKYEGFDNDVIKDHQKEIHNLNEKIKEHQKIIDDIREDCIHDFKFWCSGSYEDFFYCSKCGESVEK